MRKFFAKMLLGDDAASKLKTPQPAEAAPPLAAAPARSLAEDAISETLKGSSPTITREQIRSLIEIDMEIHGDIYIGRGVKISGRVIGNLMPNGAVAGGDPIVIVSQGGDVDGNLHARVVVVAGNLDGDIYADHVLLMPTAQVSGTVNYRHTLRQDIGSTLSGMVRRVEQIAMLDMPPHPADKLSMDALGVTDAIPVLSLEREELAAASAVSPLARIAAMAPTSSGLDIESLYRGLDVGREASPPLRPVAASA
ncbi:polymer-forming cytoskeletal protein [Chromobacterium sp. IIBBL 290-4]|uniref:bactofilin family protein n=1 Tax=Chromobacterium sp. IIBBL 290-4 TaxID=2953890 RepID=UPI0020B752A5|nr:polymer-forming cytoskeletal protein [Chromobacterium sp. IIBBL 290-4]UTH74123.1 polymer-forming cytoskeletal protein [Chromobacterium sp. IIBBL 290-4]